MSDTFETTVGGAVEKINIADLNLPQSNSAWVAETLRLAGEAPPEPKKPEADKEPEKLEAPSPEEVAAGEAAMKALANINKTEKTEKSKKSWDEWMLVAVGVQACFDYAKRVAGNTSGDKYKAAKKEFEERFGLDKLDKSTASKLRKCRELKPEIEAWRKKQEDAGIILNLNNPVAVLTAYQAGKTSGKKPKVKDTDLPANLVADFLDDLYGKSPATTATEIGTQYCRIGKKQDYPKMLAIAELLEEKVASVKDKAVHAGTDYLTEVAKWLKASVDKAAADKKAAEAKPKK